MARGTTTRCIVGVTVGTLALLLLAVVVGRFVLKAPRHPNVIMISIDTLRVDRLGVYGHSAARTPNIDGLAEGGTLFAQATTPFPRTTPAIASLFTGLWPQHHGSREVAQRIRDDIPTLAEVLRRNGYATLGISGNAIAGARQGLDRGFDRFLSPPELERIAARAITDRTLEEAALMPNDKPLLLWLHYVDPHFPYRPPKRWPDQPEAGQCRELMSATAEDRWLVGEIFDNRDGRSEKALPTCRDLYDAEIAFVDHNIGRLIRRLQKTGRFDDALVVLTSDHGENMGEAGLYYAHGPSVHDASLRIPLIIRGPDVPEKIDPAPFRLEDLMPTLLAYLGIDSDDRPPMDGVDLSKRLLRPQGGPEKDEVPLAFAEGSSSLHTNTFHLLRSGGRSRLSCINVGRYSLCAEKNGQHRLYDHETDPDLEEDLSDQLPQLYQELLTIWRRWPPESARQRTVRTPRFKLVEYPDPGGDYRLALYDLETDPSESTDVAAMHPQLFEELRIALDEWTSSIQGVSPGAERDQETLEALRALGYLK